MTEQDDKFNDVVNEIHEFVSRRIKKELKDSPGSMVLISMPGESDPYQGEVNEWTHQKVIDGDGNQQAHLLRSFSTFCMALITQDVDPYDLHQLVMHAALKAGVALVIHADEEDDEMEGMISN